MPARLPKTPARYNVDIEDILKEHTAQDRESFERLSSELTELRKDVTEVKLALQKQKGFFAGIVFVVSAIAGAIALGISWMKP